MNERSTDISTIEVLCRSESGMETKRRRRQWEESRRGSVASDGAIALEALDCTVCYHPLSPPVFQCAVGHVICSSCHDKLLNKDKCHLCAITGGYNRCIAFDHILESVSVPCSNYVYGCSVRTCYHEREDHVKSCHARTPPASALKTIVASPAQPPHYFGISPPVTS